MHFSTELDDGSWVLELRLPDGPVPHSPRPVRCCGCPVVCACGWIAPIPAARAAVAGGPLPAVRPAAYLAEHGRPIRYRHVDGEWPLASLQNVYADRPGSAEMPSAGRP